VRGGEDESEEEMVEEDDKFKDQEEYDKIIFCLWCGKAGVQRRDYCSECGRKITRDTIERRRQDAVDEIGKCMGRRLENWLNMATDDDNREDVYDTTFGASAEDQGERLNE
jgi:hypothetical protein